MTAQHISEKKKITFLFAGFYSVSALLLVFIFTVFWNGPSGGAIDQKNKRLSTDEQLSQIDNLLQDHINGLQFLDKKFAALLLDSGIKANFDSTYNKIQKAELAFKNALDSIDGKVVVSRNAEKLNLIISSYKSALENRKPIDDMQHGITTGSKQNNNDQHGFAQFKSEISRRDSTIAALYEQLKQGDHSDRYAMSFPSTDYKLLKNENKYLKSELKVMEAKLSGQRSSKASLNEANKAYANMLITDPAKSSTNNKAPRSTIKATGYEENKDQ